MPTQLEETDRKGDAPLVVVPPLEDREGLRKLALERIEAKRRFLKHAIGTAAATVLLAVIWAVSEYNNAGGWPSHGFSQSSSIPHVWNIWIVYPVLGLALLLGLNAWSTFGRRPVTETEIKREIEKLTTTR
ncbi:MAG TPA: 2TM domain-containing protein [Gaiellaceae bacterium]